jgi:MFS family permease
MPVEPAASSSNERSAAPSGATFAVVILTGMNLLNYIDRYVPSAVKDLFKADLKLTDAQTSLPLSAFVIVYMLASPVFGALADRVSRTRLIAAGVALWSVATAAAAFTTTFWGFLLARALVGVGEAAYATLAPPLLSDFFSAEKRNRVLTVFYVAIPVGAAIGFTLGGYLGAHYGWRDAFLICGLPGILVSGLALLIRDPGRSASDPAPVATTWPKAVRVLIASPTYVYAVAGYVAVTFAAGGMADWFPVYLSRVRGMDTAAAGSTVGMVTVVGGLFGTGLGGWFAERIKRRTRQPYLAVSAVSMVLAAVCATIALLVPDVRVSVAFIGVAQFFLWFYNGPINTLIANAVDANLRARAFALAILCIHLLGDAISPPIIGFVSDQAGSLVPGVLLVPVFMAIGAGIWLRGWRTVPE